MSGEFCYSSKASLVNMINPDTAEDKLVYRCEVFTDSNPADYKSDINSSNHKVTHYVLVPCIRRQ